MHDVKMKVLNSSLRLISNTDSCSLLSFPFFDEKRKAFIVHVAIELKKENDFIPKRTQWYFVIGQEYPLGSIEVYPDKNSGITVTFPHQARNICNDGKCLWRSGKLCLQEPFGTKLLADSRDPIGDSDIRLGWYLHRTRKWLEAALQGTLIAPGHPFELPQYTKNSNEGYCIIHDESSTTYSSWTKQQVKWGYLELRDSGHIDKKIFIHKYLSSSRELIREASFRTSNWNDNEFWGYWWLWPAPVVLPPWQVPCTWEELRYCAKEHNVHIEQIMRRIFKDIRGENSFYLLIGYPIPGKWCEDPIEISWQAIGMPKIENVNQVPRGFRKTEEGWWKYLNACKFSNSKKIEYMRTENWNTDRLQARGRCPEILTGKKIAIIGLGSLGSILAECLARTGILSFVLIDDQIIEAGNITRHTATLNDVGKYKVEVIKEKIYSISPSVQVSTYQKELTSRNIEELLLDTPIVLDCTGASDVSIALGNQWWPVPKLFLSFSVGYKAQRLFAFVYSGHEFPTKIFNGEISPWLEGEKKLWAASGELLEGAGCWSPLFPARYDDMLLAGAASVKILENAACSKAIKSELLVFEQVNNDSFSGYLKKENK